ncbi:MAG: hypothetical protein AB1716_02215 [Planctomycetota bacterium]
MGQNAARARSAYRAVLRAQPAPTFRARGAFRAAVLVCGLAGLTALGAAAGCERKPKPAAPTTTTNTPGRAAADANDPPPKPEYRFAEGLAESHPEVVAFLRQFLETALVGDYAGYRRMVSRARDPESRDRFHLILTSLRRLTIEQISELDFEQTRALDAQPPVYKVISRADFDPNEQVALRRGRENRVAILVLREEGEWRMAPAPAELQPKPADAALVQADGDGGPPLPPGGDDATTQPAATGPNYPWDQGGDY